MKISVYLISRADLSYTEVDNVSIEVMKQFFSLKKACRRCFYRKTECLYIEYLKEVSFIYIEDKKLLSTAVLQKTVKTYPVNNTHEEYIFSIEYLKIFSLRPSEGTLPRVARKGPFPIEDLIGFSYRRPKKVFSLENISERNSLFPKKKLINK